MSHTVVTKCAVTDTHCLRRAAQRLGLTFNPDETVDFADGQSHRGVTVRLPDWQYPVVFDPATGQLYADNYNEAWGKQSELNKLMVAYAREAVYMSAEEQGQVVSHESVNENGELVLEVTSFF